VRAFRLVVLSFFLLFFLLTGLWLFPERRFGQPIVSGSNNRDREMLPFRFFCGNGDSSLAGLQMEMLV
jgi:ATP/ADP translocase